MGQRCSAGSRGARLTSHNLYLLEVSNIQIDGRQFVEFGNVLNDVNGFLITAFHDQEFGRLFEVEHDKASDEERQTKTANSLNDPVRTSALACEQLQTLTKDAYLQPW